jgi:MFS superfamily sulfate permease-like transporter
MATLLVADVGPFIWDFATRVQPHKKPDMKLRFTVRRDMLRHDTVAGFVLGVESVPDGLAAGLLGGVNPLAGLYGYLFGTIGGSLFTSSSLMAVQATGAMAIVIADVPDIAAGAQQARLAGTGGGGHCAAPRAESDV